MKVIGFSDVITNSSSEVFVMYDYEGIDKIKEIVNSIFKCAGSNETFDSLFDIKFVLDEDYIKDCLDNGKATEKEMYDYALKNNWSGEGYPFIIGIEVTSKDGKNTETAKLLSDIGNIFESEHRYI